MTSIHQPVRPFGRGTTLLRGLISHLLTGAKFRILALASTIACSAQRKETGTSNASPHILLHCSTVRLWQNALFRPGCITVLCHELLARVLGSVPTCISFLPPARRDMYLVPAATQTSPKECILPRERCFGFHLQQFALQGRQQSRHADDPASTPPKFNSSPLKMMVGR